MKNKSKTKNEMKEFWRSFYALQTRIRDLEEIIELQRELLKTHKYADLSRASALTIEQIRKSK